MSIGRAVRTRLGRFEAPVSDFYRSRFIDLDACARLLGETVGGSSILEVGCGDGQMAEKILDRFPGSTYAGIDVAPEVGRLFRGDSTRARFQSIDSRSFLGTTPERYDLVLLVDVLHHVPRAARDDVLDDVRELTAPGGHYVLKDWIRSRSVAHLAAWASDRLLTGDRVQYFDDEELRGLVPARFPDDPEMLASEIGPRKNNLLLVYRRAKG
jgi:2-polyprenyl-3-methyl-5-hydroxy-6-metoxy-1,4-benzoquinol methylase